MKAKHTPGPWELTGDPCHFDTLTSVRGGASEIRGKGLKWRQLMVEIGGYADPATAEANARLIAAAPEMVEELIQCEAILSLGPWNGTLNRVREVLTKALGPDWQNAELTRPEAQ